MRAVGLSDLVHAARAVQAVPQADRLSFGMHLLWRAHVADKYVKRLSKLHPHWGDGSLCAAAKRHLQSDDSLKTSPEFQDCLVIVLKVLALRRSLGTKTCAGQRVCKKRICVRY
ncbi:DUF7742 family protein [Sulfitobacter guttiformis]|uniref:DUF7742 domain-containing protein n=1 Tax=Sulfitobacter guttiformis TaxID=74349 RepID=A0A420DIQ2_9RHOB|nr:hypothetical protein Z949_1281 [Sulfitobacter guttiformis KCTC 32187]RKE94110.1 hypothetical protein C8N30_3219 [Sulfitobacter guttiformis]